ncbi:MAG: RnfABCDGE type electron transport complex subunit D [Fusobacteriaceae bacterium]
MGPSPHIRTPETVSKVMRDVIIALLPIFGASIYFFGIRAIILVGVSVLACVVTEIIAARILKQTPTINDGSAIITGILFAFVVPADMNLIYVAIGAVVSIALGKMIFGGLGHNIFNPALVGRAFVQGSWPAAITTFTYDGKAGATLLNSMKYGNFFDGVGGATATLIGKENPYFESFIGNMGGCLGETSALAILLGGIYLIIRKQIDWKVPTITILTVFLISYIMGAEPTLSVLSGGLFLGAFFMATDMTTTPFTSKGRMIFAFFLGILIAMIRLKGGYPEGTAYAILIMNGFVPLINKYIIPKKFGAVKE